MADETRIHEYFVQRNVLRQPELTVAPFYLEPVDTSVLKMQKDTNATVLAMISEEGYLPLPKDEGGAAIYTPVIPVQSCYEGENLVTVVLVEEDGLVYYAEADAVRLSGSGRTDVKLWIGGTPIDATISVTVYKRTCKCPNGHTVLNTRERIESNALYNRIDDCEFCAIEPKKIRAYTTSMNRAVGTSWTELGAMFEVVFKDGSSAIISADDEELYHNYDGSYCGSQRVSVSYRGLREEVFTVALEGKSCVACGNICDERNAVDSERYDFCDACLSTAPFYFGETYVQTNLVYHDEIMEALSLTGVYYFNRGDYVRIIVSKETEGLQLPFMEDRKSYTILHGVTIPTDGR